MLFGTDAVFASYRVLENGAAMHRLKGHLLLLLITAGPVLAQTAATGRQFEVASIKPNNSGSRRSNCCGGPGRFVGQNVTLGMLINVAYGAQDFQVSGGPGWINSERWDVEAKAEDRASADEMGPMLQRLLENRFKLSVRRETREFPVYVLTVAKSASKLKPSKCIATDADTRPRGPDACGFSVMDNNMMRATQIDMARFISMLTPWVRRTIVDRIGFTATFDVDLKWNPNEGVAGNAAGPTPPDLDPSIFTALEEQLGLKLESAKGPVEVLVIDRVERPAEN
jgi:uncharacterized protein (TIGR03435 family)